ncbi:MAG: hypothetical protein FJY95_02895 [Candidatus Handelsmanbacteria bacterium]|nr:hypothetical protein [Candidatus Handelsmanbacteria bacterium]
MKTGKIAIIAVLLVAGISTRSEGLGDIQTRALSLSQAYTALARGPETVFWNPANLALRSGPRFQWELLNLGLSLIAENNGFSVKTYNDNFTDKNRLITDNDKKKILKDIPAEGLRINMDLDPRFALGIPVNGGVAFPIAKWGLSSAITLGLNTGFEAEIPKDMIELMLRGNDFDTSYDIADWEGAGWGMLSFNFAAAKPWMPARFKPYLDEFTVGGTFKILSGAYGDTQHSGGTLLVEREGADLDFNMITRVAGGYGFGLDLGVAGVTTDRKLTFSAGLLNFLDYTSWGISPKQDSLFATAIDMKVTSIFGGDSIQDALDNEDVDGDGDADFRKNLGDKAFSRSLPAMLRLGAAYQLQPKLVLLGNYDQAFSSGFGIEATPRIALGTEYRLVNWFPMRFGLTVGGRSSGSSLGFAFGPFNLGHTQVEVLDLALVIRGGMLPGGSKGTAISLMLFKFNFGVDSIQDALDNEDVDGDGDADLRKNLGD